MSSRLLLLLPALWVAGAAASSQSNSDGGIDLVLADIDDLTAVDRQGAFPNGFNACAMETTACNVGAKPINWQRAMDPDHPFIAFLLARESNGRFEQISDRSYVKHGFFALSSSFCSTCPITTDGTTLEVGCSDTYATQNNSDNYWLGPPDEIDPWMGIWNPVCSHFDRGEPPVAPPADCNGNRSLTQAMAQSLGPLGHRIRVRDAEFNVPGAFWFHAMYVVETESDAVRDDNLGSRRFAPMWSGTDWDLKEVGDFLHGTILQRWNGASVSSATNGANDGRLYVGVNVTGPVDGFYHYEYAVHNRDNFRGVGALRIPVCPSARVRNIGFGDTDQDASNEWTGAQVGSEIVYTTASNPQKWNSIFNFWFDSDAAPLAGELALDQAAPGPGLATVSVASTAPLGLYNVYLGPGCSNGTPPTLHAIGTPPQATLGNATFGLRSTGNAAQRPHYLYYSIPPGSHRIGRCTSYLGPAATDVDFRGTAFSDASGVAIHPISIPNRISIEGLTIHFQAAGFRPGSGRLYGAYDLTDGLLVRIGSSLGGCP